MKRVHAWRAAAATAAVAAAFAAPASAGGGPVPGASTGATAPVFRCGCNGSATDLFGPRCGCIGLVSVDAGASLLGLTRAQFQAELRARGTLGQVAAAAGTSVSELVAALSAAARAKLDAAVAERTITSSQAHAAMIGVPAQVAALIAGSPSRARAPVRVDVACGLIALDLLVAARTLGMTSAELWAQLRTRTLAEVAAATGASIEALVEAATNAVTATVNAGVAAGTVTEAQGQTLVAGAAQQLGSVVGG